MHLLYAKHVINNGRSNFIKQKQIYIFYAFKEFTVKITIPCDNYSIRSINKEGIERNRYGKEK